MSISKELLKILACPRCKGDVYLTEQGDGLTCERCKLLYPIINGIPVMIVNKAIALE